MNKKAIKYNKTSRYWYLENPDGSEYRKVSDGEIIETITRGSI